MKQEPKNEIVSDLYKELPSIFSEGEIESLRMISKEFLEGFKFFLNKGPFVTIFGSSRTPPDHPTYKVGYKLGELLANEDIAVLTGGGPGCMEAVNKGAKEAGGKSMGINISIPNEQVVNSYAAPSITLDHFFVRKVLLLKYSVAYIFLPGGFGTLDELFETLTLMQTGKIKNFPVILVNKDFWESLFEWVKEKQLKNQLISKEDIEYCTFVDSAEEAIELIKKAKIK